MKIALLIAATLIAGITLTAAPAQATTQRSAKAGEVREELKELKAAIEAFRKAHEAKDQAGEKAAIQTIRTIWQELPEKIKERILKNHPELAKLIERITK